MTIENNLDNILLRYQSAFSSKVYNNENNDSDLLMSAFGISPDLKRENKQYWGRELGKCWESLVIEACKNVPEFKPALRIGADEPCDLVVGNYAIDTKYRVGSGDSGTLKKFKQYGETLRNLDYTPVFLFLREDNLPAAMTACRNGGWSIYIADQSFEFIQEISGFDMKTYLITRSLRFSVNR